MTIEIRLDRNDHRVVEDFVSRSPDRVSGVVIEAPNLVRQRLAIEAARANQMDVIVETLTERLASQASTLVTSITSTGFRSPR